MNRITLLLLVAVALIAIPCSSFAQIQDVYQVTYYDNNIPGSPLDSGTIRIINPGLNGSPISANEGTLCANIYVFDSTQEMIECCSCQITANGLLTLSVAEPTENPLTVTPYRGVIKVVSTTPTLMCDPTKIAPTPDLRAFATHLQDDGYVAGHRFLSVTEDEFADAPLSSVESSDLGTICSFVRYLGTGRGRCDYICEVVE